MVGAGATTGGTMDLANLIKPDADRGEIRLVGSTTFEEFKHIEKDRALARRVQKINLNEPTLEETIKILQRPAQPVRGLPPRSPTPTPPWRPPPASPAGTCATTVSRTARSTSWTRRGPCCACRRPARRRRRRRTCPRWRRSWPRMARIPEKQASASDKERLRTLEEALQRVVFGQEEAVHTAVMSIKRARAGLGHPDHPAGCFLFTGPTGVGKTELAKQLALHLGNEFIRYDMSEIRGEARGGPPHRRAARATWASSRAGCSWTPCASIPTRWCCSTRSRRRTPTSSTSCSQVMDHATLTDNTGRKADFRQVILIMTSNAGSREMSAGIIGFSSDRRRTAPTRPSRRGNKALERLFNPEFRNRLGRDRHLQGA